MNKIILKSEISADTAETLYNEIKNRLDQKSITFDFSALEKFDASLLQILLALQKTAQKNKISLTYENISEKIKEKFINYGAGRIIETKESSCPEGYPKQ
ncbi:MAG: hypothetical protein A2096_11815 [Spirochaetes bacterium GWF1_41_5]|nr:MAG: hypothetical protein A2096_11815 [Spirochaetes bacterium GWF1_41_5]HBE01519.1 hypothetical protein [Spirochaetia bacterium]